MPPVSVSSMVLMNHKVEDGFSSFWPLLVAPLQCHYKASAQLSIAKSVFSLFLFRSSYILTLEFCQYFVNTLSISVAVLFTFYVSSDDIKIFSFKIDKYVNLSFVVCALISCSRNISLPRAHK